MLTIKKIIQNTAVIQFKKVSFVSQYLVVRKARMLESYFCSSCVFTHQLGINVPFDCKIDCTGAIRIFKTFI